MKVSINVEEVVITLVNRWNRVMFSQVGFTKFRLNIDSYGNRNSVNGKLK